jgi:VIT1/CCC1 family predicted Fe2+/Mn2+ transporter
MGLEDVYQRNRHHRTHRAGWLRAAVLGANDGIVSTASLMIGVTAATPDESGFIVTAGVAGIVAGAMSMAVGEYVSVRSQNDVEDSDRHLEIEHLAIDPEGELLELTEIYIERGLTPELAKQVAQQMPHSKARPMQAAVASAASFTLGGLVPFVGVFAPTPGAIALSIVGFALIGLLFTGITSAKIAGKSVLGPTVRVLIGGSLGMAVTAGIGRLFHISLG